MQLVKFFLALLNKIKNAFQGKLGAVNDIATKSDTGKMKGLSPKKLRFVGVVVIFVALLTLIVLNFFSKDAKLTNGSDQYKKEFTPTIGVSSDVSGERFGDTLDPLERFQVKKDGDPLAALSDSSEGGVASNGSLSMTDCLDLTEKIKKNVKLSDGESTSLQECLDKNIAQLSETDLNAMKKLADPNISEEEKKLIRKQQNNELDPGSSAEKIAEAVLDNNPKAGAGVQAFAEKDQKAMDIVAKALAGGDLTPEEKKILADLAKKYAADTVATKVATTSAGTPGIANALSGAGSKEGDIKVMAQKIAEEEAKRQAIAKEIKDSEAKAKSAAQKIAAGNSTTMTPAEQAAIAKVAELNKQIETIQKEQLARRIEFDKNLKDLNKSLMESSVIAQKNAPSGMSAEYYDAKGVKRATPKKKNKIPEQDKYLDVDGQPLTPDKIRLVKLMRVQKYEFDKLKKDVVNPLGDQNFAPNADGTPTQFGSRLGQNLIATGGEGTQYQIAETRIMQDKDLKKCNLTPDMKIPAIIDSEIIISSKDKSKMVRIKIIANVHCPQTNEIIIPKGSIAIAQATGSFDKETQIMDMNVSKVSLGSGKVMELNLSVGSANGTMGLKGKVYNTRTKYLAGAFITAFTSGALSWFGQQYVQPYQASTVASDALTGAALGGGSEVMQKLSEMYAGDLQNAPDIFWCPQKIPVILYPN